MGRRSEQRIAISFPVIVRGTDSRGAPFVVTTKTTDISYSGAALKGLNAIVEAGSRVEIECRDQKALYRVQRVSQQPMAGGGYVGLRCLEMGKYIWGVPPKEWEADTYDAAHPGRSAPPDEHGSVSGSSSAYATAARWRGADGRQFARHACRMEAQIHLDNDSSEVPGKITDISLGGCYLEMLSPLPVGTIVRIVLNPGDGTLSLTGKVRSSQTGFGMGVSFTGMGPEDFEKLRKFAPPISDAAAAAHAPAPPNRPAGRRPSAATREGNSHSIAGSSASGDDSPLDLTPTAEALEALVRLLLRKGIVTQDELVEELEKRKIILR
jgi:hypothetical protein